MQCTIMHMHVYTHTILLYANGHALTDEIDVKVCIIRIDCWSLKVGIRMDV